MEKILGLDLGTKSLGVSYYDGLIHIVHAVENFNFEEGNYKKARERVHKLVKDKDVDAIVLGYPVNMDGTKSKRCLSTERFKDDLLKEDPNLNIIYLDERLTTVEAHERLMAQGVPLKKHKDVIDMVSAVIILETYLNKIGVLK